MGAFDFPATRLAVAMGGLGSFVYLAWDVRRVAPLANRAIDRLTRVALVETEILRGLQSGLRALDWDGIQGLGDKLLIRHIGTFDGHGQGDATAIDQCRALHAQFAAIGRVFAGFFSPPSGDLVIAPSILCHFQSIPFNSSYSAKANSHNSWNTPNSTHSWK